MASTITKAARTSALASASEVAATVARDHFHDSMRALLTVCLHEPTAVYDLVHEMLAAEPAQKADPGEGAVKAKLKTVNALLSESSRLLVAAEQYLKEKGARAPSSEIARVLESRGVEIGGQDKPSRVSAYLSASKEVFDNVRGQGYGLRAWNTHKSPAPIVSGPFAPPLGTWPAKTNGGAS